MSDKTIDWIKRIQLLEKALKENRVNSSVCVELEPKISGYELDFSEHDKVFEDKIVDLQQRIRELIKEKDEYKRKCNSFGFENQDLKQRIAELESKETKKPINGWICVAAKEINGQEYVKLEDFLQVVNDLQAEIGT